MTEVLNLFVGGSITCHAWNKDRTQIALSPNSKDVLIYTKTSSGGWQLTQTLNEHSSKVLSIDWAPNSNSIVTCGADKNAYVWSYDGRAWKPELVVLRINRAAVCVKWSPNEKKFAVGCGHRCICVCYYQQDQGFWVAKHIKKQIRSTTLCLDWHPNNVLLAAGGTDFKCRVFGAHVSDVDGPQPASTPWGAKINSADCVAEYSALNHGWVHSCSFNPDGSVLAFAGHDSTIYVVNTQRSIHEVISLRTQFLPLLTLKFVSNSTILAAGHDCYPIAFGLENDRINFLDKLDVTLSKQTTGVASAKDIFGNRDRTNTDQLTNTTLNSIHQNSIKQICIYNQNNQKISHVSTCGLDGLVVIWDLNALERQFSNLRIK